MRTAFRGASRNGISVAQVTAGPRSHFCGFHDVIPWSPSGRRFLAVETDEHERLPEPEEMASIGIVDLSAGQTDFVPIGETRAWNWHLAARQQWINDGTIIYNDTRSGHHVSVVQDVKTGAKHDIEHTVWSVSKDGRWALSPNFARLRRYYDVYGYAGGTAPSLAEPIPGDDGLYLIDLKTGRVDLLFSVAEIASLVYPEEIRSGLGPFWLTHPTFNTDGNRFCFYLRRRTTDGFLHSDFLVAGRDGTSVKLLMQGLVSHFDWRDPSHVMIWARQNTVLDALRSGKMLDNAIGLALFQTARGLKRSIFGKSPPYLLRRRSRQASGAFYLLNVESGEAYVRGANVLTQDSHNMYSPDRNWMICDTYADRRREAQLFLYHVEREERIDVGRFKSARRVVDTPAVCDLHPRWNRTGTQVCVDWAQEETRQVYMADVENIIDHHGQSREWTENMDGQR